MLTKLVLITTYRCDLHCQHCLQGFPREHSDFHLELLDKLLVDALPFGVRHITLTGGEPHLHPKFEQIVETIVKYGLKWGLISHGQRVEPYLPLMKKYRKQFKSVGLSIDGATPELHDELRGRNGAFDKVTASAKRFVDAGFKIGIKTSLNRRNKSQLDAFIELATDLGAQGIMFAGTIPFAWNEHLVLSDEESLELYQKIISLRADSPISVKTASSLYTSGGVNFCKVLNLNELFISPRGTVNFCCDVHQPNGAIGSLHDSSFSSLVQSWLEKSANLQSRRAEQIASGDMGTGFDTCAFCNSYFS